MERGRPKTRFSDNVKEIAGGRGLIDLHRLAQDRRLWRATAVHRHEPPVT